MAELLQQRPMPLLGQGALPRLAFETLRGPHQLQRPLPHLEVAELGLSGGQGADQATAALCRQRQAVLCGGDLEAERPDRPLPAEPPVLGGFHLLPGCLEVGFGARHLSARLRQAALQRLLLRVGPAMGVPSLTPLLPDHAALQDLEPHVRRGCLAGRLGLGSHLFAPRLQLLADVLQPEQALGQLGHPGRRLSALRFDSPHLGRLLDQLPALLGRARHDRLDVALVHDRVGVDGEARRGQDLLEIAPPHARGVQEVLALAAAIDPAPDLDLFVVDRQSAV